MRLINADDVLDIVDDLRDRMTVEGYWSMIERVKALPSAHPEPCEDVISRAEAIRVASGYCHPANIAKELEKLPSAQPERKTGRWIYGEDKYGIDGYHCDKCGFFVLWDYAHTFINYIEDYNFCPNCGSDMRGEQDERSD